jgi:hypothetical protein
MPIRFRCVYCDKLLGIATRKAGSVVNCPQCGQPLIVPTPEPGLDETEAAAPQKPMAPAHPAQAFEQDDFDVLLEPDPPTFRGPDALPANPTSGRVPSTLPMPPQPLAVERALPRPHAPIPTPVALPNQRSGGIVLSSGMLVLAIVLVVVLVGFAFGGGYLVARMMNQG